MDLRAKFKVFLAKLQQHSIFKYPNFSQKKKNTTRSPFPKQSKTVLWDQRRSPTEFMFHGETQESKMQNMWDFWEKWKHGGREGELTHRNDPENTPSIIHRHFVKVSWNKTLKILAFPHNGAFKTLLTEHNIVTQVFRRL